MSGDVASLAAEMTPYMSAAVGAYGGTVLTRVRDEAADATVGLGRRLLQKVFGRQGEGEPLPEPLADLAADPADADAPLAAVRLAVRAAMAAHPGLTRGDAIDARRGPRVCPNVTPPSLDHRPMASLTSARWSCAMHQAKCPSLPSEVKALLVIAA